MTPRNPSFARVWLPRLLAYVLLTVFAFLMLFPFTYMLMTSFKNSSDVFKFPPRLFPYSAETLQWNGNTVEVYRFNIGGADRDLVIAEGERLNFGFFTTAENVNADTPRSSTILAQVPIDEAVATGEKTTLKDSSGADKEFDVYAVTLDGQPQQLLLAYRGALDKFVDPNEPSIFTYAVARTAEAAEFVEFQTGNYTRAFNELNLNRALINTTIVTLGVVAGQLVTSIFGGYAFSRVQFRGRDTLFLVYLGSIMIPFVVLIIPMYRLMVVIGWENRIVSLIVPWIFTAYGTFLIRQFFITIPKDLEEAALLDGASRFRVLWTIFVPLSRPAIATLAIFSFLYAWNSFLWPLLIIGEGNTTNHVLTLSMIRLSNAFADQPNLVLTGAAIAILPPIIIFILAQRYFVEGIASTGLK
ncbi:MAG: carbohydrate ABC transporter permease [Anaerolineae bacterium]|nr:carbohydrate ABC transporter permease [Anaerolineae bacterium]